MVYRRLGGFWGCLNGFTGVWSDLEEFGVVCRG